MCTAISVKVNDHYFGRNLDYEHTFGEKITVTPRNYLFKFINGSEIKQHYSIIGMALPCGGYPLYFDATNEAGLSMAGLNFPDNAVYMKSLVGRDNIAAYEFIPWILSQCKSVPESRHLLEKINITDHTFSENMPPTPLHWIIADRDMSVTVEQTKCGLTVCENPVGVLTNNPEFNIQLFNLANYMNVSSSEPVNRFSDKINLQPYSRGMGGIGIPGDISSMSRFVRATFVKLNSIYGETEKEAVNQFFHVLYSVYQQKGCAQVNDMYEVTNYPSCCNTDRGIYYYTTYNNSTVNAVDMHRENLDGDEIVAYAPLESEEFNFVN